MTFQYIDYKIYCLYLLFKYVILIIQISRKILSYKHQTCICVHNPPECKTPLHVFLCMLVYCCLHLVSVPAVWAPVITLLICFNCSSLPLSTTLIAYAYTHLALLPSFLFLALRAVEIWVCAVPSRGYHQIISLQHKHRHTHSHTMCQASNEPSEKWHSLPQLFSI